MVKANRNVATLEEKLVAPAAGINRRFAVMQNNLTRGLRGCVYPDCGRKCVGAGEKAYAWKGESIFAVELRRLAIFTGHQFGIFLSFSGIRGVNTILDFVVL